MHYLNFLIDQCHKLPDTKQEINDGWVVKKMKTRSLIKLLQYLSHLVDQGNKMSVDAAIDIFTQGNIIDWIAQNHSHLQLDVLEKHKHAINDAIKEEYFGSSSSLSNNGIVNNGYLGLITLLGGAIDRIIAEYE